MHIVKVDSIQSIAVVGAGTMGQGIAQVCTQCRSTGFQMEPIELMDDHGIGRDLAVTSSTYHPFYYGPKFRPSRIQQKKVDAGHNGKKNGRGFYGYADQ